MTRGLTPMETSGSEISFRRTCQACGSSRMDTPHKYFAPLAQGVSTHLLGLSWKG
jgi:hypothetical protein